MNEETKFPGVRFRPDKGKWVASISVKHKNKHIGYYDNKIEAIIMRIAYENFLERNGWV